MLSPLSFRRLCHLLAGGLLLLAGLRLGLAFVPLFDPLFEVPVIGCNGCNLREDPVLLLEPETARRAAWRDPSAASQIVALVEQPRVRAGLALAQLIRALPFAVLLGALALAIRSLAGRGIAPATLRWLKRSALAGLVYALAQPIAQSVRWTIFSPVTLGEARTHIVLEVGTIFWPLLLAGAAWVSALAMQQALALRTELEDFV
jgi:hypothetical protein